MNLGVVGMIVVTVGAGFLFIKPSPPDIYALPQAQVYQKLAHAELPGGEMGVFKSDSRTITPVITGNDTDLILWTSSSGTGNACKLSLSAIDEKSTQVSVSCGKASDDIYTSNQNGKLRAKVIEAVDANLTGRSYNPDKGEEGVTAFRWPNDTIVHATGSQLTADTMKQAAILYKQLPARMAEAARDEQAQEERQREYQRQQAQISAGVNSPTQAGGVSP